MADATQSDGTTATQDASTDANQQQEQQQEEFVWSKWLETQPEQVKAGYQADVHGLKSALENERSSNGTMQKRIGTLTKLAEEGTELKKELEKLGNELTETNAKADFFRVAHEARCTDLDLAWLAAKNSNLFDKRGEVDMRALREAHPALFAPAKTPVPPGNGGNGRDQSVERKPSMNDAIRQMAGRS